MGPRFADAAAVVAHLGAVQAQDYASAKAALALRMPTKSRAMTDAAIERALGDGAIVRTHAMRPTWHFVAAADVRWIQELTASRVHAVNRRIYEKLELDARTLRRAHDVITKTLEGGHIATRAELGAALERRKIAASGQRLAYIMMHAELSSLVCSGPRRGKQHTYALLDERVPMSPPVPREEALHELAVRYFTSHGPARVADFAWWSGLAMGDARAAVASAESELASRTVDDEQCWLAPGLRAARQKSPLVSLMSVFDEYVVAYKNRSDICPPEIADRVFRLGNALLSVLVVDGVVAGTWKRALKGSTVVVEVDPYRTLTRAERTALGEAADVLGRHLGLDVELRRSG